MSETQTPSPAPRRRNHRVELVGRDRFSVPYRNLTSVVTIAPRLSVNVTSQVFASAGKP